MRGGAVKGKYLVHEFSVGLGRPFRVGLTVKIIEKLLRQLAAAGVAQVIQLLLTLCDILRRILRQPHIAVSAAVCFVNQLTFGVRIGDILRAGILTQRIGNHLVVAAVENPHGRIAVIEAQSPYRCCRRISARAYRHD